MDLRDQLRILRRQWLLIVSCLLLGVAAAAVVTITTTPIYSSTARLFVSTPTSTDANSAAYQGALFSAQRVTSYADLIQGTTIAQKVIDQLQLDETATELTQQITAKAVTDTVILEVSVSDPNAARANQIAQTLAEVFAAYVPQLESAADPAAAPIKAVISDAATMPTSPVSPRPVVNIGLGAVLGLLSGLGLATLREKLDTTIKTPAALSELTGAASLGVVHFDPDAAKRPLVTQLDSHSPRLESFRVLRTNLQFLDVDAQSKVFAVTSPLPGDGKSTTALNLSITLAQAGRRTLLLEADLRRPKIAEYLHLEPTVGLTTLLIGSAGIDDVIQPFANAPGLDVITSGAMPPNPAELLQSNTMRTLLMELRQRYDVVIVDAPPILPVTDAALLAAATDGAILIAHHGKTTRDQTSQARQRLESVDAKLLGTVLNFVPHKGALGYGYGYGYGYAYESGAGTPPSVGQDLRPPVSPVAVGSVDPAALSANSHAVAPSNGRVPEANYPFTDPGHQFAEVGYPVTEPGQQFAEPGRESVEPYSDTGAHAHQDESPVRRATISRNLPR